jgi:hypothetical protein
MAYLPKTSRLDPTAMSGRVKRSILKNLHRSENDSGGPAPARSGDVAASLAARA